MRRHGAAGTCPAGLALSNSTCGSPRMTRELRDGGLVVGRRRIDDNGRRSGGSSGPRTAITPGRHHAWPVTPNLLDQDFTATGPDKKWGADIS
jgi:putative transposase